MENYIIDVEPQGDEDDHLSYIFATLDSRSKEDIQYGDSRPFTRALISVALSAIHEDVITLEEGVALIDGIGLGSIYHGPETTAVFQRIAPMFGSLIRSRISVLIAQAALGLLSPSDLYCDTNEGYTEYEELFELTSPLNKSINWLTKGGLLGDPNVDGSIEPGVRQIADLQGEYWGQVRVTAADLGAEVMAWQYELHQDSYEPNLYRTRKHVSLGSLDESGAYVPTLTILSEDHPARMA